MLNVLPEQILKYLIDKLPPFTGILMLKTTIEGVITGWYGNPADYLDQSPEIGSDVCDLVPAIFGMIPPMVSPTILSRIQTRDELIADIHIVQDETNGDFWIFFVDQTKESENIRQLLQRLNESQLQTGKLVKGNPFGALHLLDYVTFRKHDNGYFSLVGILPDWYSDLSGKLPVSNVKFLIADTFPFIDVFIIEADDFWSTHQGGNLKSGIWTEINAEGKPYYLNAYALNYEEANFLIIKPLYQEFNEEQDLMQRAREQSLAYEKLAKAERKLKELLGYKDKFVSIVSHDLRSPVAAVLSVTQMLNADSEFLAHLSDFNREMIHNIQEEMLRLLDYNDKLYHWSNLELGNFEVISSRVSVLELVMSVERTAKSKLLEKKINFQVEVPEGLMVEVDRTLFAQVLNNLVGNAVKFTPDNGTIRVACAVTEHFVELTVKDSGVGMSEHVVNRLFQGFVRNSTQGTHGEKGTGLGMGIIKKIVEAHHFHIRVESVLKEGTSFIISIPIT